MNHLASDVLQNCIRNKSPWMTTILQTLLDQITNLTRLVVFRREETGFEPICVFPPLQESKETDKEHSFCLLSGFDSLKCHKNLRRFTFTSGTSPPNIYHPLQFQEKLCGALVLCFRDDIVKELVWPTRDCEGVLELLAADVYRRSLEEEIEQDHSKPENLTKRMFIANISHEIKTPLHSIIGYFQILEQTSLTSKQALCITQMHESCTQLMRIINDVLDLSRLASGEVHVQNECVLVNNIIHEVLQGTRYQINQRLQTMEAPSDLPCQWIGVDKTKICQILINLVMNASKFSKPQSKIIFRVRIEPSTVLASPRDTSSNISDTSNETSPTTSRHRKQSKTGLSDIHPLPRGLPKHAQMAVVSPDLNLHQKPCLYFEVIDMGRGISEEESKKIFNIFTRSNSADDVIGTGLGLAICKKLCILLKGEMGFWSTLGKGSTFFLRVPYENYTDYDEQTQKDELKMLEGKTILFVDDNMNNRVTIGTMLFKWKIITILCSSGAEALRYLADPQYEFDAALLDICMPEITGVELASMIRSSFPKMPLVALSSMKDFVRTSSFDDVLDKPFRAVHLFKVLVKLFSPAENNQSLNLIPPKELVMLTPPLPLSSSSSSSPSAASSSSSASSSMGMVYKSTEQRGRELTLSEQKRLTRILVVEDSPPNCQLLVEMLKTLGYVDITTAEDGQEAIQKLEEKTFDIMLLDLKMPKVNGYGVLKYHQQTKQKCLVIAVTASCLEQDRIKCQQAGVAWYLTKPVMLKHLQAVMAKTLDYSF